MHSGSLDGTLNVALCQGWQPPWHTKVCFFGFQWRVGSWGLTRETSKKVAVVKWLKNCWHSVKPYSINQSIIHNLLVTTADLGQARWEIEKEDNSIIFFPKKSLFYTLYSIKNKILWTKIFFFINTWHVHYLQVEEFWKIGHIGIAEGDPVITSARRWRKWGLLRVNPFNLFHCILFCWLLVPYYLQ